MWSACLGPQWPRHLLCPERRGNLFSCDGSFPKPLRPKTSVHRHLWLRACHCGNLLGGCYVPNSICGCGHNGWLSRGSEERKEKIPVPDMFSSYEPLPFAGTSLASSSSKSPKGPCGPAARAIASAVAKGVIWRTFEGCAWFAFSFYSYQFWVYVHLYNGRCLRAPKQRLVGLPRRSGSSVHFWIRPKKNERWVSGFGK